MPEQAKQVDPWIDIHCPPSVYYVPELDARQIIVKAWRMVGNAFPTQKEHDHENNQPFRR